MRSRRHSVVDTPSAVWFWDRTDGADGCGDLTGPESAADTIDLTAYDTSAREIELERYGELSRDALDASHVTHERAIRG